MLKKLTLGLMLVIFYASSLFAQGFVGVKSYKIAVPNPFTQDSTAVNFLNWTIENSIPSSPGFCVTSFIGSSIPDQNNHSHTWDNAVCDLTALALDSLSFGEEVADHLSADHVWNSPYKGYFQAVSIDVTPPRANDTLDWYTKIGHSSAANISLFQYGEATGIDVYSSIALYRVNWLITWLDAESIPYFPELTPARVIANNLIPFADTPWYGGSLLYKSFEETMEFIMSLHWAAHDSHDPRYNNLGMAVFDSLVTNYWDSSRNTFYTGESLVSGNYVLDDAVAFDHFSCAYLGMTFWPELETIFTEVTGYTKDEWFLEKLANDLEGLIVYGNLLEGVRFSDAGNSVICTECTGDILACLWELDPERARSWYNQFVALQNEDGSWYAAYDEDTGQPVILNSGFGFSYDGKVAIAAKMALGMLKENWYDVRGEMVGIPVDRDGPRIPNSTIIHQNYPNPFNPTTTISFELPEETFVTLEIYNLRGQKVKILASGLREAGLYQITWDGTNQWGKRVPSGVYFFHLLTEESSTTRKMVLSK